MGRKERLSLVRGGAMSYVAPPYLTDLEAKSKAFGITSEMDGEWLVLRYKIAVEKDKPSEVRLWCHPKTLMPTKRSSTYKYEISNEKGELFKTEGTVIETYQEFILDGDIPDEKFSLPLEVVNEKGVAKVRGDLLRIRTALALYQFDNETYPTTDQGLGALLRKPAQGPAKNWKGPYIDAAQTLLDPWGTPYVYRFPGDRDPKDFEVFSCGMTSKSRCPGLSINDGGRHP